MIRSSHALPGLTLICVALCGHVTKPVVASDLPTDATSLIDVPPSALVVGGAYEAVGSTAQPGAVGVSTSTTYELALGFWYRAAAESSAAPARPNPDSAFDISGLVVICDTDEDCRLGLNPSSQVYCIPRASGDPLPGDCYVARNRYISIDPNPDNDGIATARRVSLDTGGGQTAVLGWIDAPIETPVSGSETSPQLLARLVDEASRHYRDWSVDDQQQPWVEPTVHLGDCAISPGRTYLIQAIVDGADVGNEANYSEPLVLTTLTLYGDVVGGSAGTPPDSDRSFKDISAVVRGFQSVQTEPKVWLDLQGTTQAPQIPNFSNIDFSDINRAVKGFQGEGYPFLDPCSCAALPPCP